MAIHVDYDYFLKDTKLFRSNHLLDKLEACASTCSAIWFLAPGLRRRNQKLIELLSYQWKILDFAGSALTFHSSRGWLKPSICWVFCRTVVYPNKRNSLYFPDNCVTFSKVVCFESQWVLLATIRRL